MRFSASSIRPSIGVLLAGAALSACNSGDAPAIERHVLTTTPALYTNAQYSPNGKQLAYSAKHGKEDAIWVANADGTNPKRVGGISTFNVDISWSPDGASLAYVSDRLAPPDIYVVPAGGGDERRLTSDRGLEYRPTWSADGKQLAYNSNRKGNYDLYLMPAAGGESVALTSSPASERGFFAPDGKHIGFTRQVGDSLTVWAMQPGEAPRQLTFEGHESIAAISPDGSLIAYLSTRTGRPDIWVVPTSGGAPRQLTDDIRSDFAPAFSPDGRWIAYISERGGQTDVWIVSVDGGESVRVTNDRGKETEVTWTRDGSAVTFSYNENVSRLWSVPVAGGAPKALQDGTSNDTDPRVSPDGKTVAFVSDRSGNQGRR